MSNKDHEEKTLIEKHALKRLDMVEKDQRKAYEKKDQDFPVKKIIMGIIFGIILVVFLIQLIKR